MQAPEYAAKLLPIIKATIMRKQNSKILGIKAISPEDSSDLPAQLPFRVSVSDRQAVETDVWETSGDYATLEEAVAAAKKIVDDQLEADFRRNPEDSPLTLLDGMLEFGFIPYVTDTSIKSLFNARGYAENKCYVIKGLVPPNEQIWAGPNV